MLTVRINAKRATRYPACSLLLRTCVCLLVLLGPVAHSPVEGQYLRSPCPNVFSYRLDPGSNQVFGYVQLQGLRIGQLVKLNVDLSIGIAVPQVSHTVPEKPKPEMLPLPRTCRSRQFREICDLFATEAPPAANVLRQELVVGYT
uniref:GD_N domain-containing protein n=1 Tax=Anopheles maculatus TaxID=74869 RepID=A0A182SIV2_9DIPT